MSETWAFVNIHMQVLSLNSTVQLYTTLAAVI